MTDFVGDIGGVLEIYFAIAFFFIGGYISFNNALELMGSLYHLKVVGPAEKPAKAN